MEVKEILGKCDHTLLAQTATWAEIKAICDDGMKYGCASVCIPASYVADAAEYVDGKLAICTVIGFPTAMTPLQPSVSWQRTPWQTVLPRWIWSSIWAG